MVEEVWDDENLNSELVSKWVTSKLKNITGCIGVAFSGYEMEIIQLLSRIEKSLVPDKATVQRSLPSSRRLRELRRLESGVNYDRLITSSSGLKVLMVKLLSWNLRGLNDSTKRAMLRNVLREWNCDLVCLQEMKLEDIELIDVWGIWGNQHVGLRKVLLEVC